MKEVRGSLGWEGGLCASIKIGHLQGVHICGGSDGEFRLGRRTQTWWVGGGAVKDHEKRQGEGGRVFVQLIIRVQRKSQWRKKGED